MPLDFNEIRQLLVAIAQTDIAEVTLKSNDFELTVRRGVSVSNQATVSSPGDSGLLISPPIIPQITSNSTLEAPTGRLNDFSGGRGESPPAPSTRDPKLVEVPSPMVGTFYRAPAPGEAVFVEVGDRVRSGQPVCIIEAMKLMNEIEAEISGQVIEILVENGEAVEYGQPLMRISPD